VFIRRAAKTPAVIIAALHPAITAHDVRLTIKSERCNTNDGGIGGGAKITGKHYRRQCYRPTLY
jgi:hypothetical protein